MPYYHVRIKYEIPGTVKRLRYFCEDLSESAVRTKIADPFNDRVGFRIDNEYFEGDYVNDISVFKSEQKFNEFLGEVRRKYDANAILDDVWSYIMEGKVGKNVTNMFIKSKLEEAEMIGTSIRKNIFIVHGRDHQPMKELKSLLKEVGFNPIVLHEKPSGSRTIIEKLEKYSDVGYAFVILTPDDVGTLINDVRIGGRIISVSDAELLREIEGETELERDNKWFKWILSKYKEKMKRRARQNVVLEFGYFIGLLGRDRVCCLYKGNVELPSDMHGIVYIPFKESVNEVRERIIRELREADYDIRLKES